MTAADLDPACPIHGAAVVSSGPDIPDEAVEAAFHVLYPKVPFDPQERDYLEAVAVARAALTAAYPALTRQAVAAERAKVRAVLDRAKVVVEDWSAIGEEPTVTVGDHSYVDREFFDDLLVAIDDPRIGRRHR